MNQLVVERMLKAYGLTWQRIEQPQKGYRNTSYPMLLANGRTLNLMVYKTEPEISERIKRANRVSNALAAKGLPSRQTADARILKLQTATTTKYAALYNYLPGETIPWEAYTRDHLKLTGMAMGIMHQQLCGFELSQPLVVDEYLAITQRMQRYFTQPAVRQAMHEKLHLSVASNIFMRFIAVLELCRRLPHQQVLHMDFVRSNLLFRPARAGDHFAIHKVALSGIVDFEKTSVGHPVFDIARTLAFLLVDCKYKSAAEVQKAFLLSGYVKRGDPAFKLPVIRPSGKRIELLDEALQLFLIYDFYKFLRHNPYESLEQNEHFRRTRDILLEHQMVQYS